MKVTSAIRKHAASFTILISLLLLVACASASVPVPTMTAAPQPIATSTPNPTATRTVIPSPTATKEPMPTATATPAPRPFPTLYVDGAYIRDAESGNPINFSGVSIFFDGGARLTAGMTVDQYLRFNVEANEKVGLRMNMVRLSFWSKSLTDRDMNDFAKAADHLGSKGIMMIITPHNDQRSKQNDNYYLPNQIDKDTVVKLASILRDRNNVIYGLWNEPANTDWNNWTSTISDMYIRINQQFASSSNKPIFMVSGINWSRDFRNAVIPVPLGQYVIDVHNYPDGGNPAEPGWLPMLGQVPIIVSEVGDTDPTGNQPRADDIDVIQRTLQVQAQNPGKIGVLIWRGERLNGQGTINGSGEITQRGKALLEFQKSNPPTNLLKK